MKPLLEMGLKHVLVSESQSSVGANKLLSIQSSLTLISLLYFTAETIGGPVELNWL